MRDGAVRLEGDEHLVGVAGQRGRQCGAAVGALLPCARVVLLPDGARNLAKDKSAIFNVTFI